MSLLRRLIFCLGVALISLGASASSFASTVTVDFTGKVQSVVDPFSLTAYSVNQSISGRLTIDPVSTTLFPAGTRFAGPAAFDFGPIADTGPGTIELNNVAGLGYFGVYFQTATSALVIDFTTQSSTAVPPLSLADLPTDIASILAYLGGSLIGSNAVLAGGPDPAHQFGLKFNLDSLKLTISPPIATTPLPTTLPLFASALGGFGLLARRRARRARFASLC